MKGTPHRHEKKVRRRLHSGMTLVELVVSIVVLGIITSIAMPILSGINGAGKAAKNQRNAQQLATMSTALASIGVAHVMPESLGGIEATARLLREGVEVPEGPFAGQTFQLKALSDQDIGEAASYLEIVYDLTEIRLVLKQGPGQTGSLGG